MHVNIGYILGPAGAGKSYMTGALYDWMNHMELDVITLNLDPAVVRLPYGPSIDVREFVSYNDIVDKYNLGPNGGIIAAMDQVALSFDDVLDEVNEYGAEYVLVDLPGQMETFAFRSSGPVIMNALAENNTIGGLFLIDPILCNTASSFVSILMFGVSIKYRLQTGFRYIISKGDSVLEERLLRINEWVDNPEFLHEDLRHENNIINSSISQSIASTLLAAEGLSEFPTISSKTNENIDLAYAQFQRIWDSSPIFG